MGHMNSNDLITDLRDVLGDAVLTDTTERSSRGRDYWARSAIWHWQGTHPVPRVAVRPASTDEVAAAVAVARRHGAPIVTRGCGSGVVGGVLAGPDSVVISTEALTGPPTIDDVDLLATFGAGTNGRIAEDAVQTRGCTIGHWPQSIDVSSVGGWVATRASGQYSTAYGNIEDLVHSLVAVLPDGSIYRSRATPRAAAGPDLRHLLIGSEGTLGVITEVTFSLRRLPEPGVRQALHFADITTALDVARQVIADGWRPPVLRVFDDRESRHHFADAVPEGRCVVLVLHEGPPGLAPLEADAVEALAVGSAGVSLDPSCADRWFEHRNQVPSWTDLFEHGVVADTIEVAAGWTDLSDLYHDLIAAIGAVPDVIAVSAHSSHAYRSGANLYVTFAAAPDDPAQFTATYDACWDAAMTAAAARGAGLAHHHGIGRVRRPWLEEELGQGGLGMLRAVKAALDPEGLFNPGVLIPDA